ncbi:putative oxidoreductase-like protein, N-terminal [Lyophyllum shimeji]|uniref:Oxidoreductase-like protein, N-terminal n=1 Tax=Lyophyllum shimeji TaxID=47721 RepID=A0A9P3UMT2_LYOSH|nr:putative oxidoreductase-like protein, N-terminal [Lyophyllum shimeji]
MLASRAHRLLCSPRWIAGPVRQLKDDAPSRIRRSLGRNLSERYKRLEKSLRQKQGLRRDIDDLASSSSPLATPAVANAVTTAPERRPETFHGLVIPKEPEPPRDDECCMSNCAVCVYDLYEESLEAYRKAVADLRTKLVALGIPEVEWPKNIRSSTVKKAENRRDVVQNAFEEMERALKRKREMQQKQEAAADAKAASPPDPVVTLPSSAVRRSRREARPASWLETSARLYEGLQWMLFSKR